LFLFFTYSHSAVPKHGKAIAQPDEDVAEQREDEEEEETSRD
jgi:hypothetical protein